MTGWNLPPGTTYQMLDDAVGVDSRCDVCKQLTDDCICQVCLTCGVQGSPYCYADLAMPHNSHHHLRLTYDQLAARTRYDIAELKRQIADHEYYLEWLGEQLRLEEQREEPDPDDLGDHDWEQRYDKHYPDKA
jgi:hypothetical protein